MGNLVFNVARGRAHELHARVDGNDPANSALILVVLAEAGLVADDVLRDYDTLDAILAGASNEPTNTNYARKTLTDADIAAATVDDSNDLVRLTWTLHISVVDTTYVTDMRLALGHTTAIAATNSWLSVGGGQPRRTQIIRYVSN